MSTSSSTAKRPREPSQTQTPNTNTSNSSDLTSNNMIKQLFDNPPTKEVSEFLDLVNKLIDQPTNAVISKPVDIIQKQINRKQIVVNQLRNTSTNNKKKLSEELQKLSEEFANKKNQLILELEKQHNEKKKLLQKTYNEKHEKTERLIHKTETEIGQYMICLHSNDPNIEYLCIFLLNSSSELTDIERQKMYTVIAHIISKRNILKNYNGSNHLVSALVRILDDKQISTDEKIQLLLTIYSYDLDNLNHEFIRRNSSIHGELYDFLLKSISIDQRPRTSFSYNIHYTERVEFFKKVIMAYGFTQYKKTKF